MARKPILFQPQLFEPQGINNFSGVAFRCFTIGDTLPFRFTFQDKEGEDFDVSLWQVKVAIASSFDAVGGIQVTIPLVDAVGKVFEGEITNTLTKTLTPGIHYALAKYVTDAGYEHIIDMCVLEVYSNLLFVTQ